MGITSYTGYIPPQSGNPTHDLEHIPEIQRMINETIKNVVPQMIDEKCGEMVRAMIGALEYDVRTCVDIAFNDASDIFHSEKARQFVSDSIVRQIENRLNEYDFSIDL